MSKGLLHPLGILCGAGNRDGAAAPAQTTMHERAFRATAVVDRLMTFSQLSHSATVQPPFHTVIPIDPDVRVTNPERTNDPVAL